MTDQSAATEYPEHEKLKAITEERDHVQGFLDWLLDETPVTLAAWDNERPRARRTYSGEHARLMLAEAADLPLDRLDDDGVDRSGYRAVPHLTGGLRESLLAAYFGIDPRKLSDEKEAMLASLR